MPTLIHAPANSAPVWPYSLADLRRDNPNVSFSANPSADDLAPFDVFVVAPTEPPEHDPATHRVEEVMPVEADGQWHQAWQLIELPPVPPTPPAPDWATFKSVALQSATLNDLLSRAFPLAPIACTALAPALLRAESNGAVDFAGAWAAILAVVPLPPEELAGLNAMAQACNLPEAFIEALDPAAAGLIRARDEFGRFIPDDPATPEDEAWVPAE